MTIYLDVLLLSNLWADYALLRTAAAVTHTPFRPVRGIAAALTAAASSLMIFLPELPLPAALLGRILPALLVCGIAFGFRARTLLRMTPVFLGMSAVFCGIVFLFASLRTPAGWYLHNSVIYADVSLLTLLLGTTAAAAVSVIRARRAEALPHRTYRLHLRLGGQDFLLPALADTGNSLRDAFSGKPVIVCGSDTLSAWMRHFPDAEAAARSMRGFRMIPAKTVAGTRLLPAFLPDHAAILQTEQSPERAVDILLALTAEPSVSAILPAILLH